jgi:3-dehydroquinate dehydratase / shikimate dehydrogenase
MIYDPLETRLIKMAKAAGAEVIPGIEMFVQQAARQFEIWTGKPAPADEMMRVVSKALEERAMARQTKEAQKK